MLRKLVKFAMLIAAAAAGVVAWQRRNETPATAPATRRASEPFMAPAPAPVAAPEAPEEGVQPASVEPGTDAEVAAVVEVAAMESATPLPGPPREAPTDPLPDPPRRRAAAAAAGDDLKRISGVGPKIEAVLLAEGITTLQQLAALDEDGIDALQARLPQFPGRIRRDDWVGQARRLTSG